MRKIYLLLNIIFISTIVFLLNAYSHRIEAATVSTGKKDSPKKKIMKNKMPSRIKPRSKVVQDYTALLADSKLFDKDRGEEEAAAAPVKAVITNQRCNLKLMGVCHFGKMKGAIIVSTGRTKDSEGKSFFKIGEDVGEGFKLYEITDKTAILKSGNRQVELELSKAPAAASQPVNRRSRITQPVPRVNHTNRISRRPRR